MLEPLLLEPLLLLFQAHDTSVRAMRWSHNDQWMVTADHSGYIKYWQTNMNNVKMYQGHKEPIRGIRWEPEPEPAAVVTPPPRPGWLLGRQSISIVYQIYIIVFDLFVYFSLLYKYRLTHYHCYVESVSTYLLSNYKYYRPHLPPCIDCRLIVCLSLYQYYKSSHHKCLILDCSCHLHARILFVYYYSSIINCV